MKPAIEVYRELIMRCKAHVKSVTKTLFDPLTGVQSVYVAGKLTERKKVT